MITLSDSEKILYEGLTYDDVLLLPTYSKTPLHYDVKTKLTRRITLNIPLISSAMDTVTEADLAIAIAKEGGIGFIHRGMNIKQQADEVRKVKHFQTNLIIHDDLVTLNYKANLEQVELLMEKHSIGTIPIVDDNKKLVGIITNRDIRFIKDLSLSVQKVMIKKENLVTAPETISLEKAEDKLKRYEIKKLPIIDSDYKLIGLITYKDILKNKLACRDENQRLRVGGAIGVTDKDIFERTGALRRRGRCDCY